MPLQQRPRVLLGVSIIFALEGGIVKPVIAKPASDPPVLFFAAVGAKQVLDWFKFRILVDGLFYLYS